MANCIICGKDEKENYMIDLVVNDKKVKCCPLCVEQVDGNITKLGYIKELKADPENKANKNIDIYFEVNPEFFANASYIKLSFTYENDIPIESWKKIGKIHLTAIATGHSNNIKYVEKMIKSGDETMLNIYNSIKVITKEEYEKEN